MNRKYKKDVTTGLFGQYVVFTGKLNMSRTRAIVFVKKMGGHVQSSVTRKTTLLVLGNQNKKRLRQGHSRTVKHDAVRKRIKEGQAITILQQEEFYTLLNLPSQLSLFDFVEKPTKKIKNPPSKKRSVMKKSRIQHRLPVERLRSDV